jgi:hypothetical protein
MRMTRTTIARLLLGTILAAASTACGAGSPSPSPALTAPPATPTAPAGGPSGTQAAGAVDCGLLTAADFATAGLDGAGTPSDNPDGTGGHYCVYAGTSGATGGIEFDVFASEDVATAQETYRTVIGEGPAGVPAPGAQFSASSFAIDGEVAYLAVRQGRLVIALSVPNDINVDVGLASLATLAVQRAGDAAGE